MWYEVRLPTGIGASASPHELEDKAWRMQNAVWKNGVIEDIEIPLGMLFVSGVPVFFLTSKQCYDVVRSAGYINGREDKTVVTAFATETDVVGYVPNGDEVINISGATQPYRLLAYSLNRNIGIMIFGTDRRFFDGATVHTIQNTILSKPPKPSVSSAIFHSEPPIEYRYRVVFAKTDLGFLSPPSDPVGCFGFYAPYVVSSGSDKEKDFAIYLHPNVSGSAPTSIDKVYIYRWTEIIGVYTKIAEVNVSDWWTMTSFQDTTPADFISNDVLPDVVPIPTDPVTALNTSNGRVIYGMDNKIIISEPSRPFWMDADTPVFVLDSTVENIFRWGSHFLVQTRFNWYRLFETEGGFLLQPISLPLPSSRTGVRKTRIGLVIVSWRGAFLFTTNEELLQLPINFDIIEGRRLTTQPTYVRVFRDYVDIVLQDGRYFRVSQDGNVSGLHDRLRVFAWGE